MILSNLDYSNLGRDVNTRDLIAKIQLSGDGSALNRTAKSSMGASPVAKASGLGLDRDIAAQINIRSGASSIAEAVV
jgi:hypothetical protein